jgi:WD40 repeat protein
VLASGFLDAARRAVRGGRRRRGIIAVLSALTLAAGVAAGAAWHYALNADQQHDIALSRQLANDSLSLDATDPVEARQLAVAAWRVSPTTQASNALVTLVTEQERNGELPAVGNEITTRIYTPSGVDGVAFSPDGWLLASVNAYGYIRVWNLTTGSLVTAPWTTTLFSPSLTAGNPWQLAISPDDRSLVTADPDGNVQLWQVADGRLIRTLAKTQRFGPPSMVAFSADGAQLAIKVASQILLWDQFTGVLTKHSLDRFATGGSQGTITGLTYTTQGDLLISVESGEHLRVWDMTADRMIGKALRIRTSGRYIYSTSTRTAIDSGGTLLASFTPGNSDIQLWTAAAGRQIRLPISTDRPGGVTGMAFSPNGYFSPAPLEPDPSGCGARPPAAFASWPGQGRT